MDMASQLIRENKLSRSTFINLGKCGLNKFPVELLECVWLESINFSNFTYYDEQSGIFNFTTNDGPPNVFSGNEGFEKLQQLPALRSLHFTSTKLSNINFLHSITGLKTLTIGINTLTDLTPIASLRNLAFLFLTHCEIKEISALRHLSELRVLILSDNPISDLSPLASLTRLNRLDVGMAKLTDISALNSLTSLEQLALPHNKIESINGIQGLYNLKEIQLVHNKVRDLVPLYSPTLRTLPRLEKLNIMGSNIEYLDIRVFDTMPNLRELLLNGNPIKNVPPNLIGRGDISEIKAHLRRK